LNIFEKDDLFLDANEPNAIPEKLPVTLTLAILRKNDEPVSRIDVHFATLYITEIWALPQRNDV